MQDPSPTTTNPRLPILIIGAGISGLTLAQACRKHGIPYRLFERDTALSSRGAGWGLTLNFALPALRSLLPDDVLARLPEAYVNGTAMEEGERGSFTFFDLRSGEARWRVPFPAPVEGGARVRVSRKRLRGVLLRGVEVEWGRSLVGVEVAAGEAAEAVFADGSRVRGRLVVGCDGANSAVRRLCFPDGGGGEYVNERLPVRMIGAGVRFPEAKVRAMLSLDPFFLQGSHPETEVFLWFSFLDVPGDPSSVTAAATEERTNGATATERPEDGDGQPMYRCQIMTSYPYRAGFLGRAAPTEPPTSHDELLSFMKTLAADFTEPFRSVVQSIPSESEVKEIHLADWRPRSISTTPLGGSGRVVLIGDAAHTMVMYRGEGANHAIVDAGKLVEGLLALDGQSATARRRDDDAESLREMVSEYEAEMIERTDLAVAASRRACLDAHEFQRLNEWSPLVRRRLMRADLEEGG